jgi:hypothetical protein
MISLFKIPQTFFYIYYFIYYLEIKKNYIIKKQDKKIET